jgi:hypothetical protein
MVKRFFLFMLIVSVVSSCSNSGKKVVPAKTDKSEAAMKVEFSALVSNPESYIGKNIIVEGKVIHVCTETGKKMFIVGKDPDIRLYVAAGENISKFPMELLGSEIIVEGRIIKAGGTGMDENVKPVEESGKGSHQGVKSMSGDSCETETALKGQPSLTSIILEYKSHTLKE